MPVKVCAPGVNMSTSNPTTSANAVVSSPSTFLNLSSGSFTYTEHLRAAIAKPVGPETETGKFPRVISQSGVTSGIDSTPGGWNPELPVTTSKDDMVRQWVQDQASHYSQRNMVDDLKHVWGATEAQPELAKVTSENIASQHYLTTPIGGKRHVTVKIPDEESDYSEAAKIGDKRPAIVSAIDEETETKNVMVQRLGAPMAKRRRVLLNNNTRATNVTMPDTFCHIGQHTMHAKVLQGSLETGEISASASSRSGNIPRGRRVIQGSTEILSPHQATATLLPLSKTTSFQSGPTFTKATATNFTEYVNIKPSSDETAYGVVKRAPVTSCTVTSRNTDTSFNKPMLPRQLDENEAVFALQTLATSPRATTKPFFHAAARDNVLASGKACLNVAHKVRRSSLVSSSTTRQPSLVSTSGTRQPSLLSTAVSTALRTMQGEAIAADYAFNLSDSDTSETSADSSIPGNIDDHFVHTGTNRSSGPIVCLKRNTERQPQTLDQTQKSNLGSSAPQQGFSDVQAVAQNLIKASDSDSGKKLLRKRILQRNPTAKPVKEKVQNNTLTEEEELKRSKRRQRNKEAAQRCRARRNALGERLFKEFQDLECQNTTLKYEVRKLEKEQEILETILKSHVMICKLEKTPAATVTSSAETSAS